MDRKILVETSARHVHVNEAVLKVLFGEGASLTPKKELSQPGQFASMERVDIVGSKSTFKNVIIIGPCRKDAQIEISLTDARALGCDAPVRESGDIAGSGSVKLVGPNGEVELKEGVIAAKRHIHMTPEDAQRMNLADRQIVSVKVVSADRSLIFGDVVLRVSDSYATAMHIDTDESNAAGLSGEVYGEIL